LETLFFEACPFVVLLESSTRGRTPPHNTPSVYTENAAGSTPQRGCTSSQRRLS